MDMLGASPVAHISGDVRLLHLLLNARRCVPAHVLRSDPKAMSFSWMRNLASLAAHFTTAPIGNAAGKFKGRLIERSKKRATQWRMGQIHSCHPQLGFCNLLSDRATGFVVFGFLTPQSDRAPFGFIGLTLFFFMSVRRLWIVVVTLNRVRYFRDYEAQLKKRWPDLVLTD